jgi:Oligonucleotide/oligosaccharide-binding (OB)-fold
MSGGARGRGPRGAGRYDKALNANSNNWGVVKGVLLAGLFPSVCRVLYKKGQTSLFTRNDGAVQPHPGSVTNPRERSFTQRWAMYYAKVKSSSLFLMDLSEVSPVAICLFGGPMHLGDARTRRVSVETGDGDVGASAALPAVIASRPWVTFEDVDGAGSSILQLRTAVEARVRRALENPSGFDFRSEDDAGQLLVNAVARALQDAEAQEYHGCPWRGGGGGGHDAGGGTSDGVDSGNGNGWPGSLRARPPGRADRLDGRADGRRFGSGYTDLDGGGGGGGWGESRGGGGGRSGGRGAGPSAFTFGSDSRGGGRADVEGRWR